ncbi:ankyrin [Plakobranchus ocellatus]|uniref:Ankyrin n=1 Tax=Plakobranchus ocellatus TaxID=259542 RepID=A0AAV3YYQ5_9GAST|nr:ankyrin [Plakobranchus ocellatus]
MREHEHGTNNRISQWALDDALLFACRAGWEFFVQILISAGADVDTRSPAGFSPLMVAAEEGNAHVVRLLLSNGAHAQHTNLAGETALKVALYRGHLECAKILLEEDNVAEENLERLARYLARAGRPEALKLLASHCNDEVSSQILLMPAVMSGDTEIVQSLLDRGADINMPSFDGDTALVAAVKYLRELRLINMVIFLVINGAQAKQVLKLFLLW